MIRIAIFASGNGSNAVNLYDYFNIKHKEQKIIIECIICNNPEAGVIEKAKQLDLNLFLFDNSIFKQPDSIIKLLKQRQIDYIILAGFLRLIHTDFIKAFPNKIINIHPALLPKYGGKGMYGSKVHEAVIANKEIESGITIHLVNAEYDKGEILKQAIVGISPTDSEVTLAKKIHELEYIYFPKAVKEYISRKSL
ncbi:MAG: phosphoribosylglycinamide formyltransferase [Bacteroidota bacterium]|nr:phosphoribosylglycinamide formyltransferase [Bacteroidota bacterium]